MRAFATVTWAALAVVLGAAACAAEMEHVVVLKSDNVVVGVGTATQPLRVNVTISETSHIPLLTLRSTCGRLSGDGWGFGDALCSKHVGSKRFIVYVRASHHWERNINFRMWRNLDPGVTSPAVEYFGSQPSRLNVTDRAATEDDSEGSVADAGFAALEPRTEITKSCSELLDECVISKYMTYTGSFKYVREVVDYDRFHPEEAVFRHRLACRVDGAEWGTWNLRIGNSLPHDASTTVEVIVVLQDRVFSTFLLIPLVLVAAFLFCAMCAAALLGLRLVGQRRQRVAAENARRQQMEALRLQQAVLREQVLQNSPASGTAIPSDARNDREEALAVPDAAQDTTTVNPPVAESPHQEADTNPGNDLQASPIAAVQAQWSHKLRCLVKGWRGTQRRQLLPGEGAEELATVSSSPDPAEEEEGDVCRICRTAEPRETLFSPCRCNGSSRFVHRECLAQWRAATSNPEHRRVCAECKAPYRIVQRDVLSVSAILNGVGSFVRSTGKGLATLGSLFIGGYVLKLWFFLATWDHHISWSAFHPYHLALGLFLIIALVAYFNVMSRYIDTYPLRVQQLVVLAAVLLTVPVFGYIGQFVIYLIGHTVWTWEVCFGCGLATAYIAQANIIAVLLRAIERYNIVTDDVADREEDVRPSQQLGSGITP